MSLTTDTPVNAHTTASTPAAVVAPATARRGVSLSAQGLSKRYGARSVLNGADLQIEPGEFVAIVGRSGCGKSTLLRLVAGLETASAGTLQIDQRELKGLRENTRIMFQDARLLPWKRVIDNVALGLPVSEHGAAAKVLEQVCLLYTSDAADE